MYLCNILTDTIGEKRYVSENNDFDEIGSFRFYENSTMPFIWDVVIVYERVLVPTELTVREGGLWFISGEPSMSREYPRGFLTLFDLQLTSHHYWGLNNVVNDQQALDWWYCKSFKSKLHSMDRLELENMSIPSKTKNISIISSNKRMMPGHNFRQNIVKHLKKDFKDEIDFYGGEDGNVDLKKDAIDPYRFCISIENSSVNDYWTEKLADPLLGYTIPIYSGCLNIDKYFDTSGMFVFDVRNYQSIKQIIQDILSDPQAVYASKSDVLSANRKMLFDKHHLFEQIKKYSDRLSCSKKNHKVLIRPIQGYSAYNSILLYLRFRRALFKIFYLFQK